MLCSSTSLLNVVLGRGICSTILCSFLPSKINKSVIFLLHSYQGSIWVKNVLNLTVPLKNEWYVQSCFRVHAKEIFTILLGEAVVIHGPLAV